MNPKISVIVPVYNVEDKLSRCLDSILNQTYMNFELIIVNDGSTDSSGLICNTYQEKDNRVKVFHKINGGVSSARNLALENISGDYVTFCDSDDYVENNWLKNFSTAIDANVDLAIQGFTIIDNENKRYKKSLSYKESNPSYHTQNLIIDLMPRGLYGFLWVKLFKTSLIRKHQIKFDVLSTFREDEQFLSEYLIHVNTFHVVDKVGYNYFLPPNKKKYKGDPYYSLIHIFKSLDVVFGNDLPRTICALHVKNVRDYIVKKILSKKKTDEYILELYKRMMKILKYSNSFSEYLIYLLLYNSPRFRIMSYYLIKCIHGNKS